MKIFQPGLAGRGVRILSTGAACPARLVTNADLVAAGAPFTDEEIVRLSGIRERRWVGEHEATSDLAVQAGRQALERAGVSGLSIDRLILATTSPDYPSPSAACLVQAALGLGLAPAMDVAASCSGFLYALDIGARAIATGDDHTLVIAADVRSRFLNVQDRATCALFGDGSGSALLAPGPVGVGLVAIGLAADGAGAHAIYIPAGGSREPSTAATVAADRHFLRMDDGPQVYMAAVVGMLDVGTALLTELGLSFDDVDLLIPHQANWHVVKRVAWKAKIPLERVFSNLEHRGNVSGASIAVALDEALVNGRLHVGDRVLMLAAGAGHTAGAALYVVDEGLVRSVGP